MSCFIVSPECISIIIRGLELSAYERCRSAWYGLAYGFPCIPDMTDPGNHQPMAEVLHGLNVDAYCVRYGEDERQGIAPINYQGVLPPTPIQFFKAVQSLIYQCSEGDILEREIYKALVKIGDRMARNIVSEMPDYAEAKWG